MATFTTSLLVGPLQVERVPTYGGELVIYVCGACIMGLHFYSAVLTKDFGDLRKEERELTPDARWDGGSSSFESHCVSFSIVFHQVSGKH